MGLALELCLAGLVTASIGSYGAVFFRLVFSCIFCQEGLGLSFLFCHLNKWHTYTMEQASPSLPSPHPAPPQQGPQWGTRAAWAPARSVTGRGPSDGAPNLC